VQENVRIWPGDAAKGEIEIVEERLVWRNDAVRLFYDRVRFPGEKAEEPVEAEHFRLTQAENRGDGVVVAPITADDHILLVRQFRHPARMWLRELPRGGRERGETPEDAVARELREETGREVETVYPLGRVAVDSGQLGSVPHLFAARVRDGGAPEQEETEAIDRILAYRFSELLRACQSGEVIDGPTLATVLRLAPHFADDRFRYHPEVVRADP
jgi:8-oxo-dGTP pyrophosphatase MutT (NUDIX family)